MGENRQTSCNQVRYLDAPLIYWLLSDSNTTKVPKQQSIDTRKGLPSKLKNLSVTRI